MVDNPGIQGKTAPKRGGCLAAFLILMMIVDPLVCLYYLFAGSTVTEALPNIPGWYLPLLILWCLIDFACALAIWNWKKWGVYGFGASSFLGFILNSIYFGILFSISGLLGIVLLFFLIRSSWDQME